MTVQDDSRDTGAYPVISFRKASQSSQPEVEQMQS